MARPGADGATGFEDGAVKFSDFIRGDEKEAVMMGVMDKAKREQLRTLALAATQGEFKPFNASDVLALLDRIDELEGDAGRWMDVSVDGYPDKACKVLIARGNATVLGAWIGDSFWYSNEKVAALFWRHLPARPDPARGVE